MTRLPSPKIVTDSVVVEGEQYPPMSIVGEVTNSVKPVTPNETTGKVIAISSRLTHKDSALGNQLRRKRLEKQVA
jgi:protein involved in polysaccharide export with SLBB domain